MHITITRDISNTYLGDVLLPYKKGEVYELEFKDFEDGKMIFEGNGLYIEKIINESHEIYTERFIYYIVIKVYGIVYFDLTFCSSNLGHVIDLIIIFERRAHGLLIDFAELKYTKIYVDSVYLLMKNSVILETNEGLLHRIRSELEMVLRYEHPDPRAYTGLYSVRTKSAR